MQAQDTLSRPLISLDRSQSMRGGWIWTKLLRIRRGLSQTSHLFGPSNHSMFTPFSDTETLCVRNSFCSHPTKACVQHTSVSAGDIPSITYGFSYRLEPGIPTPNITCLDNYTLRVRGLVSDPGMLYEFLGKVQATNPHGNVSISCIYVSIDSTNATNATVVVSGASDAWFTWVGGTNYDQGAGDLEHGFSFQGPDPHTALVSLLAVASPPNAFYPSILSAHTADYKAIMSPFVLSLGQTPNLSSPTDKLVAAYKIDVGDAYLEWLLFNYGRYMLASSARGDLPANLQGKWAKDITNPWSAGKCTHFIY